MLRFSSPLPRWRAGESRLNDRLKAAVASGDTDATGLRAEFDERRWVRSNLVRTTTTLVAFGLLCWALVEAGATR